MYIKLCSGITDRQGFQELVIEVSITRGIQFHLVGLADSATRESRKRIYAALKHNQYHWPGQRITVNLQPATLRKEGASLDLPIALGILAASKQVPTDFLEHYLFAGELGLDGSLNAPDDAYALIALAIENGYRGVLIPALDHSTRPVLPDDFELVEVFHLNEAVAFLRGERTESSNFEQRSVAPPSPHFNTATYLCYSDVSGQRALKAALALAAAGGHHLLIMGPPGTGKSLLTANFPGIQAQLLPEERPRLLMNASANGRDLEPIERGIRPYYRAEQSLSHAALFGTAKQPQSGLYAQVKGGALLLDEFSNYSSKFLNELLGPMDSHEVQIIGSMNPCKCGYLGHAERSCQCSSAQIRNYRGKLSSALWDRFDLFIEVEAELWSIKPGTKERTSDEWKCAVDRAYKVQWQRQGCANASLPPDQLRQYVPLSEALEVWLEGEVLKRGLSTRSHHHVLKVARTIADFKGSAHVEKPHLLGALALRNNGAVL